MHENGKSLRFVRVLSVLYMVFAVWLLIAVCGHCYPMIGEQIRQVIGGWKGGAVHEAFRTLADSLEAGLPLKETAKASAEVLFAELA